jgi:hypothetical protein
VHTVMRATLGLACGVLLNCAPLAAPAAASTRALVCDLSFTLNFTSALPLVVPASRSYTISGHGGSCNGSGSSSVDISSAITNTATVSCAAIAQLGGSATLTFSNGTLDVTFTASGPSLAQSWTFVGTVVGSGAAQGGFTWTSLGEIGACEGGTGTAMTLAGVITVATT